MVLTDYRDFRSYMKDELERRIQVNPKYSLRAFSRDLRMSPQRLSFILRGKRGLSLEAAALVSRRLGLGVEETNYFCDLVQYSKAKTDEGKRLSRDRLERLKKVDRFDLVKQDVFSAISLWYHYPILELTFIDGFQSDSDWIAKKLGVTVHEANQAIERLIRLGLLQNKNGQLEKTKAHLTTPEDVPSDSVKSFNRQILQKAMEAVSLQTIQERDFSTMTMAIDPTKIPKAKTMIKDFRRELMRFLESGKRKNVYCFSTQLFNLTKGDSQ